MKLRLIATLSVPLLFTTACGEPPRELPPPSSTKMAEPADTATTKSPGPLAPGAEKSPLPPSHPPIGDAAKPLKFTAPAGWVSETPGSAMRREQYRLAKHGEDKDDAVVTVSFLAATEGGPVEGNLDRWAGQFTQPDGKSPREALKRSDRKLGSANVIDLDITGTYALNEKMMGGSRVYNEPNWRMLMSWIQSPAGNYYVKLVGPADTVAHWESSFRTFVSSAAP